jgi:hypothetical protein
MPTTKKPTTTKKPSTKKPEGEHASKTAAHAAHGAHDAHTPPEEDKDRLVDSLTSTVDDWRARLSDLRVQADLAKLDARDVATKQLDIAQNACLAAASKLREARRDATVGVQSVSDTVRKLLEDVKEAFDAAQAVISRG